MENQTVAVVSELSYYQIHGQACIKKYRGRKVFAHTPHLVGPPDRNELVTVGLIEDFTVDTRMFNNTRQKIPGLWDFSVKEV
jgi:hypothetical protein